MRVRRRTYEGTGILPGMEDQPPQEPKSGDPAPPPRTRAAKRIPKARIAAVGIGIVMGTAIPLYGFYRVEQFLIRDPRFVLTGEGSDAEATLEIGGAAHVSRRAIETVFTNDLGRSIYLMPLSDRRASLQRVEWVRDATIVRLWPNRVVVQVTERKPVAFVSVSATRFGLIDADGVILPPAPDKFKLPVLAGMKASDPLPKRRDGVHRMLQLTSELGNDVGKISEINVADRDNLKVSVPYDERELTLLLGDRDFAARYKNFVNHYTEIQKRLPGATILDLRLEDRITVVQ